MAIFKFTNKAVGDLTNIWDYTKNKRSENQADIYFQMLIKTCEDVAIIPDSGKDYSDITPFLLGIKSGRHIIFYQKVSENQIEIIRILHAQMDLKKRLKGEK